MKSTDAPTARPAAKRDTIEIVCSIDDNYVKYCIVLLTSLFENNPGEQFRIHVIADALSEESVATLGQWVRERYHQRLSIHIIDPSRFSFCPDPGQWYSMSTYYRCFLTEILPDDIDRALYLDSDMIVTGSIRELWDTDLTDCAVGVVEDMTSSFPDNYTRLHYSPEYSYFNAGMVLFNLDYWRHHNMGETIAEYIRLYPERLAVNDQDALNATTCGKRRFLPLRWNMQDGFFRRRHYTSRPSDEIKAERRHAAIIHFTGKKKPWHEKCVHPYKRDFQRYLDMTPWRGERPPLNILHRLNALTFPLQNLLHLKNGYSRF